MASITEEKVIKGSVSAEQAVKGELKDVPYLDNTLTKEGYAADSKAVGDALETKAPSNHTHTASEVGAAEITHEATGSIITLNDSGYAPLFGLKLYGKTTQNGNPTPSAPVPLNSVGDSGSVNVSVSGKNLFDPALLSITEGYNTYDASTGLWTTNSGGGWSRSLFQNLNGTSAIRDVNKLVKVPQNTTITIKFYDVQNNTKVANFYSVYFADESGKPFTSQTSAKDVLTITTPDQPCYMDFIRTGDSGSFSFSKIQIEIGNTATEYEPYKGQSVVISTPNGLPGIPVSSGGNYTDASGQQWICDEVDFARGVYMKRIGEVVYTGNESITVNDTQGTILTIVTSDVRTDKIVGHVVCSHFVAATAAGYINKYGGVAVRTGGVGLAIGLNIGTPVSGVPSADRVPMFKAFLAEQYANGTPVTAKYVLATPIETPLSAEELAQYAALHTNNQNTTLFNSANADMEIVYCSPNTAVPVNLGRSHAGKILAVNEHGFVETEPKPTASDVGAAPAGFGLGAGCTTIDSVKSITKNGWYLTNGDTPDGGYWFCRPKCTNDAYNIVVVAWSVDGKKHAKLTKNGTWEEEWEWYNAPLNVGVEYRTTERWYSYPVYIRMINMQALPNNYSKQTSPFEETESGRIIDAWGFENASGQKLPTMRFGGNWNHHVELPFSGRTLTLSTNFDGSAFTEALITVKYIKY